MGDAERGYVDELTINREFNYFNAIDHEKAANNALGEEGNAVLKRRQADSNE